MHSYPKILVCCVVCGVGIALAVSKSKAPSGATPEGENTTLAAKSNPTSKITAEEIISKMNELHGKWTSLNYVPFRDLGDFYGELTVAASLGPHDWEMTKDEEAKLNVIVRSFLRSLTAESFLEYRKAIADGTKLKALPRIRYMRDILKGKHLLPTTPSLSEDELFEIFWAFRTDFGRGHNYFDAIAINDIRYQLRLAPNIDNARLPPYSLWNGTLEHEGTEALTSVFDYSVQDISHFDRSHKGIKIAIVLLYVRTNPVAYGGPASKATGYPIMLSYAWIPNEESWLPLSIAELWKKTYMFPIY